MFDIIFFYENLDDIVHPYTRVIVIILVMTSILCKYVLSNKLSTLDLSK